MTKNRHLRPNAELDDETTVVLRGGSLDSHLLRIDAQRNFEIYGFYGLSVFAVVDTTVDELAQAGTARPLCAPYLVESRRAQSRWFHV